jgi:uncharacterized protein (TIGR02147 family)
METEKQKTFRSGSFRIFLQQELVRRCRSNSKYSLRSFARTLDVSPSALSAILSAKRALTTKMIKRLALKLDLNLEEINQFVSAAKTEVVTFQQVTLDTFAIISDWYHYAILELIRVKSFKPDKTWIASALGITRNEVNMATDRLERVGLLKIQTDGRWVDTSFGGNATNIERNLTSSAQRKLQKQILEMSIKALEQVPIEHREHSSITMAINPLDLPLAKEKIKAFRRELMNSLEQTSEPTQVYNLGVSLYPVTKINTEN